MRGVLGGVMETFIIIGGLGGIGLMGYSVIKFITGFFQDAKATNKEILDLQEKNHKHRIGDLKEQIVLTQRDAQEKSDMKERHALVIGECQSQIVKLQTQIEERERIQDLVQRTVAEAMRQNQPKIGSYPEKF